jgi:predicted nucleic acid-binding protein
MRSPAALLDSNVVVAAIEPDHMHHEPTVGLLTEPRAARFAVAGHSFAEAFVTLTRRGGGSPFARDPRPVWAALDSLLGQITLLGLTPAQSLDCLRDYARAGGIGPRIYDMLIGRVAELHGIPTLLTWNTGHMRSLFPGLDVATPAEYLARA